MTELTADEQCYLLDVFTSSPRDWFLPRDIDREKFSDRTIDQIVASLARAGLMDGQPDCHARLTDQGRKTATQLSRFAKRDWGKFYKRRRVRIAVLVVVAGVSLIVVVLRSSGVL